MTSPSARYQHSPGKGEQRPRPGRADRTLPGHRRSGSYQVTNAPAGGCRVLPPAPARRFGGRTRDSRSVRRRAKTGTSGKTRPACAKVAVDHRGTTLWMSHGLQSLARTNPEGSVRGGQGRCGAHELRCADQVNLARKDLGRHPETTGRAESRALPERLEERRQLSMSGWRRRRRSTTAGGPTSVGVKAYRRCPGGMPGGSEAGVAAVCDEDGAGDEGGGVAGEEDDGGRELLDRAVPLERSVLDPVATELRLVDG